MGRQPKIYFLLLRRDRVLHDYTIGKGVAEPQLLPVGAESHEFIRVLDHRVRNPVRVGRASPAVCLQIVDTNFAAREMASTNHQPSPVTLERQPTIGGADEGLNYAETEQQEGALVSMHE